MENKDFKKNLRNISTFSSNKQSKTYGELISVCQFPVINRLYSYFERSKNLNFVVLSKGGKLRNKFHLDKVQPAATFTER